MALSLVLVSSDPVFWMSFYEDDMLTFTSRIILLFFEVEPSRLQRSKSPELPGVEGYSVGPRWKLTSGPARPLKILAD